MDVDAVVTDFDGVHTDDTVLTDADGRESVRVSRSDGMGIARLRRAGIPVLILSTETNPVVGARARKLRVDVRQGVDDKAAALLRVGRRRSGIPLSRIAYLGNDINDLACLEARRLARRRPGSASPRARRLARRSSAGPAGTAPSASSPTGCSATARRSDTRSRTDQPRIAYRRAALMTVTIGSRVIGGGRPAYVIAEIGLNHNGDVDLAKQLIDVAADAGADAVKFQKRTPEISTPAHMRDMPRETPWGTMTYLDYRYRVEFTSDAVHRDRRPRAAARARVVRVAVGRAERARSSRT